MTKTFVGWFSRTAIFCGDWFSICAGAFPESHTWSILTMVQLPHVFVSSRNTTRTRIPSWIQNRFCTSGWPLPVDSLSGRFNYICVFVWRNLLQLAPSSHQNSLFQIIGMLNADLGMLSALGMLNLGMLDAGFGMLSASGMQDLVCCLHLVCRIFFYIFASVLL